MSECTYNYIRLRDRLICCIKINDLICQLINESYALRPWWQWLFKPASNYLVSKNIIVNFTRIGALICNLSFILLRSPVCPIPLIRPVIRSKIVRNFKNQWKMKNGEKLRGNIETMKTQITYGNFENGKKWIVRTLSVFLSFCCHSHASERISFHSNCSSQHTHTARSCSMVRIHRMSEYQMKQQFQNANKNEYRKSNIEFLWRRKQVGTWHTTDYSRFLANQLDSSGQHAVRGKCDSSFVETKFRRPAEGLQCDSNAHCK